jgi:hypothetical protein
MGLSATVFSAAPPPRSIFGFAMSLPPLPSCPFERLRSAVLFAYTSGF